MFVKKRNILLLNENKIPGLLGSIFDFGEIIGDIDLAEVV